MIIRELTLADEQAYEAFVEDWKVENPTPYEREIIEKHAKRPEDFAEYLAVEAKKFTVLRRVIADADMRRNY
ncbi:MAG: hypothetical protein LBN08_05885 [Lactobacillales bacterium]|jgi:hypothetical protein|nr:hypothetical protein [Lactobacillales bacterium]